MLIGQFPTAQFQKIETPFYYYDMDILRNTLEEIKRRAADAYMQVHYAVKACATPEIMREIAAHGFGADCVNGEEIKAALAAGFPPHKIVFAGVGKTDREIRLALEHNIFSFNVESLPELEVINELASEMGKKAPVCLRINPNVNAHTHQYITTGLNENKFGINMEEAVAVANRCQQLPNIHLLGLHFHIGSQITDMEPFQTLCVRVNQIMDEMEKAGHKLLHINVGGGLGVNYEHPNHLSIPDFEHYFDVFRHGLHLREGQTLHFELGRSMVAQCGNLITRVLYVKQGTHKKFIIVDAGMSDLIRPALYQAFHRIENLTSDREEEIYDVVGPICESSDVFVKDFAVSGAQRGDLLALRSAGAYGEIMASGYNLRRLPGHITSDDIKKND